MKARKVRDAAKDGRAIGAWLSEQAPHVLLREFSNRPVHTESPATKRWREAWSLMTDALGDRADEMDVVNARRELDQAFGDSLVEHEDRAWHAAWTMAMSLRGK